MYSQHRISSRHFSSIETLFPNSHNRTKLRMSALRRASCPGCPTRKAICSAAAARLRPPASEKGIRVAQKMQVGPCIPRWKHRCKRMKPAQLLGQLGVFLTCACCWNNASVAELPGSSALRFLQSCIASWLCSSFFRNSSRRSSAVYEGALSFVTAMRYPIGILHANENWSRVMTEGPRLKTGSPAAAALLGRSTASLASAPPSVII